MTFYLLASRESHTRTTNWNGGRMLRTDKSKNKIIKKKIAMLLVMTSTIFRKWDWKFAQSTEIRTSALVRKPRGHAPVPCSWVQ